VGREILENVSYFSVPAKVAFAKRKICCTQEWARAETGGHAYRRGTVLVLARRDDLVGASVGWFVVEHLNPYPSKTEGIGTRKFNGVRLGGVGGCATRPVCNRLREDN